MTKEWTWQAEREALVKRVKELEGLADFWHERSQSAHARIAELDKHLSAICEQADRPEYSGRYAELLRRIADARAALGERG